MSSQSKGESLTIEHVLRYIYKCERGGFGGNIDSDAIELNPVQSYLIGLAPIYKSADNSKKKNIDNFIENLIDYENMSIDQIGIDTVGKLTDEFEKLIR